LARLLGVQAPDDEETRLGNVQRKLGQPEEAEASVRHALAIFVDQLPEDHAHTRMARSLLAQLVAARGEVLLNIRDNDKPPTKVTVVARRDSAPMRTLRSARCATPGTPSTKSRPLTQSPAQRSTALSSKPRRPDNPDTAASHNRL